MSSRNTDSRCSVGICAGRAREQGERKGVQGARDRWCGVVWWVWVWGVVGVGWGGVGPNTNGRCSTGICGRGGVGGHGWEGE